MAYRLYGLASIQYSTVSVQFLIRPCESYHIFLIFFLIRRIRCYGRKTSENAICSKRYIFIYSSEKKRFRIFFQFWSLFCIIFKYLLFIPSNFAFLIYLQLLPSANSKSAQNVAQISVKNRDGDIEYNAKINVTTRLLNRAFHQDSLFFFNFTLNFSWNKIFFLKGLLASVFLFIF